MQLFSLKKLTGLKSGANQKAKFLRMPLTYSNVLSRTLLAAGWEIINRMSQQGSICQGLTIAPTAPENLHSFRITKRRNESAVRRPRLLLHPTMVIWETSPVTFSLHSNIPFPLWTGPLIAHLKNGKNSPLSQGYCIQITKYKLIHLHYIKAALFLEAQIHKTEKDENKHKDLQVKKKKKSYLTKEAWDVFKY